MKTAISTFALLFALAFGLFAQASAAPQVFTTYMSLENCQTLAAIMPIYGTVPCAARAEVFITDAAGAEAFQVTLNYKDSDGNARVRTQVVAATPSAPEPGSNAAVIMPFKADITLTSVQVTALDYVGSATTVNLN